MRRMVWHGRIGFCSSETLVGRYKSKWGTRKCRWNGIDIDGSKSTNATTTSVTLESVARQQPSHSLRRSYVESGASVEFLQVTPCQSLSDVTDIRMLIKILFSQLQRQLSAVEFEASTAEWRTHSASGS